MSKNRVASEGRRNEKSQYNTVSEANRLCVVRDSREGKMSETLATSLVLGIVLLAGGMATASRLHSHNSSRTGTTHPTQADADDHLPIVDFEQSTKRGGSEQERAIRQARGERYRSGPDGKIREYGAGEGGGLFFTQPYLVRLAALPVATSDAVVLGTVRQAEAFLSSDRTNVYSEYTIEVREVLKGDRATLAPHGDLVAERAGGAVRFPSGKIQRYGYMNAGMPRVSSEYVFFLKRFSTGEDHAILTAYELRNGIVYPLDGDGDPNQFAVARFAGVDATAFQTALARAIADNIDYGKKGEEP